MVSGVTDVRRPNTDFLRDGIYELRAKDNNLNLRVLYFFDGQKAVVLSHGIVKQKSGVPGADISLALKRKIAYMKNPKLHTAKE